MISCLLSDVNRPEGIPDNELNRNTISIDVGRHIVYKGEAATFNLESRQRSVAAYAGIWDQFVPQVSSTNHFSGTFAL
jgi:hypothetical protein